MPAENAAKNRNQFVKWQESLAQVIESTLPGTETFESTTVGKDHSAATTAAASQQSCKYRGFPVHTKATISQRRPSMQVQNRQDNIGKWNLSKLDEMPEPADSGLATAEPVKGAVQASSEAAPGDYRPSIISSGEVIDTRITRTSADISYGFGLGKTTQGHDVVTSVSPKGPAFGKVRVNDVFTAMQGVSTDGLDHDEILSLHRASC